MKNETRKNNFKFNILGSNKILLLGFVVTIILLFSLYPLFNNEIVYAEENELELVNFNQISNNVNVNITTQSTVSEGGYYYTNSQFNNTVNFIVGHKYYIIFKLLDHSPQVNNIRLYFNSYSNVILSNGNRETALLTFNNFSFMRIYATNTNFYSMNYVFNAIDLNIMFGDDNIPTKEYCDELFVSEYYPYTNGTPVALDSLNAYVNAYNDLFSSYQYLQTTNALGLNSYSYRFNNSDATFEYNNTYRMWYFKNTFATPLLTTLSAGTKITINYKYWASNFDSTSYFLNVSFLDRNNGGISSLYTSNEYIISLSELDETQTITFTLPVNIDTLFFNVVNNNNVDVNFNGYFFTFEILASQFDINTAIATAYQRGIDSISDRVLPGGDLYESIYTTGFNAGSQNGYIVSDSMSFVGQMFHGIGDILSMELIPNIPIGLFVALPLLVGLLFFIVKIAKGSGG